MSMVRFCDRCQREYTTAMHNTDFVHVCNSGDDTLDNDSVVVVGSWEDFTGSATIQKAHQQVAGTENELQGTRAGIEGEKFAGVNVKGDRLKTHRLRRHEEYINLKPI